MGFRLLRNTAALSVVLVLAGCAPHEPEIMPVPEPSATPIFASDEDALAAATDAYAKYLKVSDEVFAAGGAGVAALTKVLTGNQLRVETDGFSEVQKNGWHSVGATMFDQVQLQRYDTASVDASIVVVYLCEDISGTDVLDKSGKSVVAAGLPKRSLYEVTFDRGPGRTLLVSDKQLWESGNC